MNKPVKLPLIYSVICMRRYTFELTCSAATIEHDDDSVMVDAGNCKCYRCCIHVCPIGSIDEWRVVNTLYPLEDQIQWNGLPKQEAIEECTEPFCQRADYGMVGEAI